MMIIMPSLSKSFVFNFFFLFTRKRKAGVFKFLRFEERFRKALFSCRISVDGGPDRRNKATFSNFSGEVVGKKNK